MEALARDEGPLADSYDYGTESKIFINRTEFYWTNDS
jgi:hypothetical protein